jgi:hypothetical protein
MVKKLPSEEYTPEEAARRAREAIARSFTLPYKPQKEFVGKTPRARAQSRKRTKDPPKSP